jgi:N-acetylglucosaminyl-diphospho-decaprenol L-rhamnosyltransferase
MVFRNNEYATGITDALDTAVETRKRTASSKADDGQPRKHCKPDVSVVIVSYNGKEVLANCLQSLFKKTGRVSFEVIVSDNGSTDGCVTMIRERFHSVRILENRANLGFAAANNRAFRRCEGRYIMLLNPDTLLYSDAISEMVMFMDANPQIGLCGPKLLNADGSLQFSARNFPSVANQLAESLLLQKVFPRSERSGELILNPSFYSFCEVANKRCFGYSGEKKLSGGKDKSSKITAVGSDNGTTESRIFVRDVDWVTGAALMIRREAVNDIGPLDERYFMYSEEKDWCFGAHRKGWPVVLYPGAEIVHLHGDSGINPELFKILVRSKMLFLLKNYPPFKAYAIIAIMRFNLAIRFAIYSIATAVAGAVPGSSARDSLSRRLSVIRAGLSLAAFIFLAVLHVSFSI